METMEVATPILGKEGKVIFPVKVNYYKEEEVLNTLQTRSEILGVLRASEALVFVIGSIFLRVSFRSFWFIEICAIVNLSVVHVLRILNIPCLWEFMWMNNETTKYMEVRIFSLEFSDSARGLPAENSLWMLIECCKFCWITQDRKIQQNIKIALLALLWEGCVHIFE